MLFCGTVRIAHTIVWCSTPWQRFRGLMFRKEPKNTAYIFTFTKEVSAVLHMLWVFFSIDVLWLDKHKNIVALRQCVRPFTPWIHPGCKAQYVVELPKKTIEKYNLKKGQQCRWLTR